MNFLTPAARATLAVLATAALPAVSTGAGVGAQSSPDPLRLLEAASEVYAKAATVCASFAQVLEVPLLDRRSETAGRLCQAKPNRFAMRYSDPEGDLLVADGSFVWMYNPSEDDEQVLRRPMMGSGSGTPLDFRREFLDDPRSKYSIEAYGTEWDASAREEVAVIRLDPKEPTSYERAILGIGVTSALIRRIELHEENGTVRTLILEDVELDGEVAVGTFSFDPPPGVRVITR